MLPRRRRGLIPNKISVAIPQLTGGGAEKVTTRIAEKFLESGLLSRVYTGSGAGAESVPGLPLHILHSSRALQAMPRFFGALSTDAADAFLLTLGYVALAPAIRLRRPHSRLVLRIGNTVGAEVRSLSSTARLRYLAALRIAVMAADAVVAQSEYMAADLARHIRVAEAKLTVIYNFVEDELWSWQAPSAPPLATPYLFCAARMAAQKGYDVLLAGFARSPRRATARLVVGGVQADDSCFDDLMRRVGLGPDEVVRLGFVPDPYPWIAHAEVCVLASRFEGFSNFLLEAAALGKKIVATDCPGGNAELFRHYRNVETVPVDDAGALAVALETPRLDLARTQARAMLSPFEEGSICARYKDVLIDGWATRRAEPGKGG